jgi:uncharacterized protein YqfA (UPF0365 family)
MIARVQEMRARVVAEAQVPLAMSDAFEVAISV